MPSGLGVFPCDRFLSHVLYRPLVKNVVSSVGLCGECSSNIKPSLINQGIGRLHTYPIG